jgi:hypothetical protein
MKKFVKYFGLTTLAVLVSVVAFAATPADAPETTAIDDCVNKKSAVEFPHKVHMDLGECVTCHHTQEGLTAESDVEVQTCGSCHTEPEAEDTPKCSEMSLSKNPFHKGCIACHKERVAEDASISAPTKCDGCHPKVEGGMARIDSSASSHAQR